MYTRILINKSVYQCKDFAFSALTLLVGERKGIPLVKKLALTPLLSRATD